MNKNTPKGLLLLVMLALAPIFAHAQTYKIADVMKVTMRGIGPVVKGNEVQGYYMFYQLDKADKANNNYQIKFIDQNLNEIATAKMTDSKYLYLQEASFDGQFVMLKFWEAKEKQVQLRKYDGTGKQVSKKVITLTERGEFYQFYTTGADGEIQGESLFAVDGKGFVNFTQRKTKGWGFQIDYMGDDGKTWTYNANMADAKFQYATYLASDKNNVYVLAGEKAKMMAYDVDYTVLAIDIATGKKKYQTVLKDAKYEVDPMSAYIDNQTGNLAVMGLIYPGGDGKGQKNLRSQGLACVKLNAEGQIVSSKYNTWATEFSKHVSSDAKGKIQDVGYIYFHRIVQTADGNVYAVGEDYKKAADGMGIAVAAMGGSGSFVKMVVEDIYIFEFDKDFNVKGVQNFEKSPTSVSMPQGAVYIPTGMLGTYVKALDGFDYQYTQINKDNTLFTVCYVDMEKNKGEKREAKFGAITFNGGKYTTDKISLETEANTLFVYPAKTGSVMISEYFKKAKSLETRLEKINY